MRTRRLIASFCLLALAATATVQTPEQYFGFRIGSDKKLVRWDKIVEYLQAVANGTDRVRFRNLGPTTNGNPFILLEISSAENLRNLDRLKNLERKLYFQGGAPTDAERDEIFRSGKAVVFITNNIHSTEIGASQMVLELVHNLATSDSPAVRKVLDNVILLLVPSLNPDGQIMVTDWYNKTLGTPSEASPLPFLYHNYTGHDNNRDMYLFSQKESQMAAQVLWHEWFPSIWLDEHQQGTSGPRIFTMPATDPDQPQCRPADLSPQRHFRTVAGRRPGSGRQDRYHLQFHLHQFLAGRHGVGRMVAQPGGPAHRSSQRAHRHSRRAAEGRRHARRRRFRACYRRTRRCHGSRGRRRRFRSRAPPRLRASRRPATAAPRHHAAHRISAPLDGRPLDSPRHRGLRTDRHQRAAGSRRGWAREPAPPDLQHQSQHHRGR